MTYRVFLQQTAEDSYKATPLAFPDCVAVGKTRDEALANLFEVAVPSLTLYVIVSVRVSPSFSALIVALVLSS